MTKKILILVNVILVGGIVWVLLSDNSSKVTDTPTDSVITISKDGQTQYIKILAKGGYWPKQTEALANIDTVLEVETQNTYDCSLALVIPKLNYRQTLSPNGITKIEIPALQAKDNLDLVCSMGMYRATIDFS